MVYEKKAGSEKVAAGIREVMKILGITQKELANYLNISQPAISLYLKGRMPPADILYRIAQMGGLTVEQILAGGGGPPDASVVREASPLSYGVHEELNHLWDRLPLDVRDHLLGLIRHLAENH